MSVVNRTIRTSRSDIPFPQKEQERPEPVALTRLIAKIVRESAPPGGFEDAESFKCTVYPRLKQLGISFTVAQVHDAVSLIESNTPVIRSPYLPRVPLPARAVDVSAAPLIGRGQAANLLARIRAVAAQRDGVTLELKSMPSAIATSSEDVNDFRRDCGLWDRP